MFESRGEELKMLVEMSQRFARKELRELAEPSDHYPDAPFIAGVVEKARGEGLLALVLPEELGGIGSLSALGAVVCEMGKVHGAFGAILLVQAAAQGFILNAGSADMKKRVLGGNGLVGCPLYDEVPDWGVGVRAEKGKGKGAYTLNGESRFVPLSPVAEHLLLAARCDGELILYLLPVAAKGVTVGKPLTTLGLRACPVADVTLKDCKVVKGDILAEGKAASDLLETQTAGLFGPVSALSAGIAEGSYQAAMEYAKERYQGGRNIAGHQQVRVMLADMAADAARGIKSAAELCAAADDGAGSAGRARAAFIRATDDAARACIDGVQILGGYGYMQDYGQERRMRDSKQAQLLLGRNDVHRLALMEEELSS